MQKESDKIIEKLTIDKLNEVGKINLEKALKLLDKLYADKLEKCKQQNKVLGHLEADLHLAELLKILNLNLTYKKYMEIPKTYVGDNHAKRNS